jgi:hypothetical protein
MSQIQALKSSVSLDLEGIVYCEIDKRVATNIVIKHHYLHRKASINDHCAFAAKRPERSLIRGILGVVTFGTPRSLPCGLVGEKKQDLKRPDAMCHHVRELNRVWLSKALPPNSESRFVSWCLRELKRIDPHAIVVSYADSAQGHRGTLYQSLNFVYCGTPIAGTDKTIEGKDHRSVSRERLKRPDVTRKTRRKHRYVWFANKRDKKLLAWDVLEYPKIKSVRIDS